MREWLLTPALVAGLVLALAPAKLAAQTDDEAVDAEVATEAEMAGGADTEAAGDDHSEGGGESRPDPLAFDLDLAPFTAIVFGLMLAVLSQIAWKPIMQGLKAREDGVLGKLSDAERMHLEAKAMLAEHEAKLAGAADEVRALLEEARRDADATIAQAKAEAKEEFEAERQRAMRDIEQATDAAVRQLAERSAGLAIDLAGRVVKQDITADRQSEIVREALGRFGGADPSVN